MTQISVTREIKDLLERIADEYDTTINTVIEEALEVAIPALGLNLEEKENI